MITLRRDSERRLVKQDDNDIRLTFYTRSHPGPHIDGFGILAIFKEIRFPPGGSSGTRTRPDAEVITYVFRGQLAQEDSSGYSGVLRAGEFQYMSNGTGVEHKETNASQKHIAHVFRIALRPTKTGLDCVHKQNRFTVAQRRNQLCIIASHDGRKGSLHICQDAFIYSSILDSGHHLVQEILPGRTAWIHIVSGEVKLNDIILNRGDSASIMLEPSVSLTVLENSEILLVDLAFSPESLEG